ncbi:MAG: FxsA family protein [Pseudomonadota bacterium]|nr:FxsA family protein [Pseudomonadota bacterium]
MRSKYILAILFIIIPIIEIILFIEVGSKIGTLNTIILIFGTAIIGFYLIKNGSISYFSEIQNKILQGIRPEIEILSGMIFFLAGFLLIVPGFFTDSVGVLLLIPPIRHLFLQKYTHFFLRKRRAGKRGKTVIDVDHINEDK